MSSSYRFEKFILTTLCVLVLAIVGTVGYYAGYLHVIRDSSVQYQGYGVFALMVDGEEYNYLFNMGE